MIAARGGRAKGSPIMKRREPPSAGEKWAPRDSNPDALAGNGS